VHECSSEVSLTFRSAGCSKCKRDSSESSTDFCGAVAETVVDDYASLDDERDEEETRSTLRAMCEASRGRQLRLIRAETDSGRSDGLLNTLTCRQPSARLHFLRRRASFTTRPNLSRPSTCARCHYACAMCTSRIDLLHERAILRGLAPRSALRSSWLSISPVRIEHRDRGN
jgi:hypothetical protein